MTAATTNQSLYVDTPAKLVHSNNDCYFFLDLVTVLLYNYYINWVTAVGSFGYVLIVGNTEPQPLAPINYLHLGVL